MRFFIQEFIPSGQRERVLVIGDKAVAAITRPTRWRRRFTAVEGVKKAISPVPKDDAALAVKAAKAAGLDISGVDIVTNDTTSEKYILEANAAPSWGAIKKDTGIIIEEEILKYLMTLLPR